MALSLLTGSAYNQAARNIFTGFSSAYPATAIAVAPVSLSRYQQEGFFGFPAEIRNTIYSLVIDEIEVVVNQGETPPVQIRRTPQAVFVRRKVKRIGRRGKMLRRTIREYLHPKRDILTISSQWYLEIREVIWRHMNVTIARRWDALRVFLLGIPFQHQPSNATSRIPTLFLPGTTIISSVQSITLNLCNDTDFEGRVAVSEVHRVMASVLEYLSSSMPRLRHLTFDVDHSAKVFRYGFVPEVWFLEALVKIKRLKSLHFRPGPGLALTKWRAESKEKMRDCIMALTMAFMKHIEDDSGGTTLLGHELSGSKLQILVVKKMLIELSKIRENGGSASQWLTSVLAQLEDLDS